MGYREDQLAVSKVTGMFPTSGMTGSENELIKELNNQVALDGAVKDFLALGTKEEKARYLSTLPKELEGTFFAIPEVTKQLQKDFPTGAPGSGGFSVNFSQSGELLQTRVSDSLPPDVSSKLDARGTDGSLAVTSADIMQIASSIDTFKAQGNSRIAAFESAGAVTSKTENALKKNEAARMEASVEQFDFLETAQRVATTDRMQAQKKLIETVGSDENLVRESSRLKTMLESQDQLLVDIVKIRDSVQDMATSPRAIFFGAAYPGQDISKYFPELAAEKVKLSTTETAATKVREAISTTSSAIASSLKFKQDVAAIKTPGEIEAEGLAVGAKILAAKQGATRQKDITDVEVAKANEQRVLKATELVDNVNRNIASLQIQLAGVKNAADKTELNAALSAARLALLNAQTDLTGAKTAKLTAENLLAEGVSTADSGRFVQGAKIMLGLPEETTADDVLKQYKVFGDKNSKALLNALITGNGQKQGVENIALYSAIYENPRMRPVLEKLYPEAMRIFNKPETARALLVLTSETEAAAAAIQGDKQSPAAREQALRTVTQAQVAGAASPETPVVIVDPKEKTNRSKDQKLSNPYRMSLDGALIDPAAVKDAGLVGTDSATAKRLSESALYATLYAKENDIKKVKQGAELGANDVMNTVLELFANTKTEEDRQKLATDAVDIVKLGMSNSFIRRGLAVTNFPAPSNYAVTLEQRGLWTRIVSGLKDAADVQLVTEGVRAAKAVGEISALGTLGNTATTKLLERAAARKADNQDALNELKDELPTKTMKVDLTSSSDWLSMAKFVTAAVKAEAIRNFKAPSAAGN